MTAPNPILDLVARFNEHIDVYKAGHYNETQLRRDFLDPFFKELGWDIDNVSGHAEAYRDVIHEDQVRVSGNLKAPDYGFRIGGQRKFFLEAKKPAVRIKEDISAAYQLRRYAWSAKLSLSILSDFEEFAIYDTRVKPSPSDAAATARIFYCRFEEYAKHWGYIASIFSRESILKGGFDKYSAATRGKRGTAEVDDDFLATIEGWRSDLARNLALRNPSLTQRELNFAVQRVIDRIIFLRICEDRGIEDYERLKQAAASKHIYQSLSKLFEEADQRYNSGLFHFHPEKDRQEHHDALTPSLVIDDDLLRGIIRGLYYPDCPYEFSVLSADILGQVYEQFLGKVISLTSAHRAVVEFKPEVKRAGGVFYTPTYIVNYIVRRTVGPIVEGKSPKHIEQLTILDPACGSGSFLIGAYQFLLDWYHHYYSLNEPEKVAKGRNPRIVAGNGGGWALTTWERKRILLTHIFGVDIDSQAVEVTKLSLLLKVMEGETAQIRQRALIHDRVLPDLGSNIKCGNSLVDSNFYAQRALTDIDAEAQLRINAFDWEKSEGFQKIMRSGGFSVVIGNPPYDVLEKDRGKTSWPHDLLAEYSKVHEPFEPALGGKLNLFRFFVVRSVQLVRRDGAIGMIVPMSLLADISCAKTRRFLLTHVKGLRADCFPQKDNPNRRVFRDAKLSTMIYCGISSEHIPDVQAGIHVRVYPGNSFDDVFREASISMADTSLLDPDNLPIPLVSAEEWQLCVSIHKRPAVHRLGELRQFKVTRGEINQTVYARYITDNPSDVRLLKGVEIGRYLQKNKLSQGHREWFDESAFLRENAPRPVCDVRRLATQRITGVDERLRVVASVIEPKCYFADSTNSVVAISEADMSLEYLLAILNSKLTQWRFKLTSMNNNVGTNELECLPIRVIDLSSAAERSAHDRIVGHVIKLLGYHRQRAAAKTPVEQTVLDRQIAATDALIESEVYGLYSLTEAEIAVVETPH